MSDYPTRTLKVDSNGWLYDSQTGEWSRLEGYGHNDKVSLEDGWMRAWLPVESEEQEEPERWGWPVANEPVGYIGDGSYLDLHPTRFSWTTQVEAVARYLVDNYDCSVNTYVDHPPGWGLDSVSLDIWGPGGRGDQVNDSGDAGFWDIFNNGEPPWIRWCIRDGYIWDDYYGWRVYWDNDPWSDAGHWQHRHITFYG